MEELSNWDALLLAAVFAIFCIQLLRAINSVVVYLVGRWDARRLRKAREEAAARYRCPTLGVWK